MKNIVMYSSHNTVVLPQLFDLIITKDCLSYGRNFYKKVHKIKGLACSGFSIITAIKTAPIFFHGRIPLNTRIEGKGSFS